MIMALMLGPWSGPGLGPGSRLLPEVPGKELFHETGNGSGADGKTGKALSVGIDCVLSSGFPLDRFCG